MKWSNAKILEFVFIAYTRKEENVGGIEGTSRKYDFFLRRQDSGSFYWIFVIIAPGAIT